MNIQYRQDDKEHKKVIVSESDVADLANSLDELAHYHIAKSEYQKAKLLLKSAIAITKESGRTYISLEKYQSDYANSIRKTEKFHTK